MKRVPFTANRPLVEPQTSGRLLGMTTPAGSAWRDDGVSRTELPCRSQVMRGDWRRKLVLGSLPGPYELRELREVGIRRLVNLCGAELREIYEADLLAPFESSSHVFPDVFSEGRPVNAPVSWNAIDTTIYLDRASPDERKELLVSIRLVRDSLKENQPIYVFCGLGRGCSPLVAAAALLHLRACPLPGVLSLVRALRPSAQFTDISVSALKWSLEQEGICGAGRAS